MLDAIKHGLSGLINFNGRDARQAFWYYVLFIYLLTTAVSMVVVLPTMLQSMMAGMQHGMEQARGHDPVAAQAAIQASMMASMSEIFPAMLRLGMVTGAIMILGLGAAFVRRLQDSDLPGWWALLPAACQLFGLALLPAQLERMQQTMQSIDFTSPMAQSQIMRGSLGAGSLLGWLAIGIVVALGARKSTPGPNRYGDVPFIA